MPDIYVIRGPNGAGKSTVARGMLPGFIGVSHFVNADEIAKGLSGFAPESVAREAGRIMLKRLTFLAQQRMDFAFESTLASRSFAPWLAGLQGEGYGVHIVYLWLRTPELAVQRVTSRVRSGGHDVAEEIVRRRYERGLRNFARLYAPFVDSWEVYDNSELEPRIIAYGGRNETTKILESDLWSDICTRSA